jgi:probable F420-dependent oxidoreductase
VSIWTSLRQWVEDPAAPGAVGEELEQLGFGALWMGGSTGQIAVIDAILAATSRLVAATGITQIWSNPADQVAAEYHRLNDAHGDRFVLGLGVGHAPAVEASGQRYHKPLSKLRSYLDELDHAARPVPASGRIIAAQRSHAMKLAAERAAGAHPFNVPPAHTAQARRLLGPEPILAPGQKILFDTDRSRARQIGRDVMAVYLDLPNYRNNLRDFGLDDDDFANGGSDRLIDTMVAWGTPETVRRRVQEHLDAGADTVAVQVLSDSCGAALPRREWHQAAKVLLDL